MIDKIGQSITKGCFLAYGCLLDRSAGLQIGKVVGIKISSTTGKECIQIINEDGVRTSLQFPERTIVIDLQFNTGNLFIPHRSWDNKPEVWNWTEENIRKSRYEK